MPTHATGGNVRSHVDGFSSGSSDSTDPNSRLLDAAINTGEGILSRSGSLVVQTGAFTGRSPDDKYIVDDHQSSESVWWGSINQPMSEIVFDGLAERVRDYLGSRQTWTESLAVGADQQFAYPVQLTTEHAWVALFCRHLFIVPANTNGTAKPITILHAPELQLDPAEFGMRSSTVIALHVSRQVIVIAGTSYAGEVKKSVFTLLQYLLPNRDVLTMHCSANVDSAGRSTLFFGLSGTGKTTLSNDSRYRLVGDDEHGWSENGIFNLEGGCYAKTLHLSRAHEPEIFAASIRKGSILENVILDSRGDPDFDNSELTENTRAAFSLEALPHAISSGTTVHPSRIVLLTADATGVLPPVSKLTHEQAINFYLLGFTSKVAGTERDLDEPEAIFSPTFGAPFLPLPPSRYAQLLAERIGRHQPSLWLVNTGWTGGSPGSQASRIDIEYTRAIVRAIMDDSLLTAEFTNDPVFDLAIPAHVPGVPDSLLQPRLVWDNPAEYDDTASSLRQSFIDQSKSMSIEHPWD